MTQSDEQPISWPAAYLFALPFQLFLSPRDPPASIVEIESRGLQLRIYPPFSSGDKDTSGLPKIHAEAIPYKGAQRPRLQATNGVILRVSTLPDIPERSIVDKTPVRKCTAANALRIDIYSAPSNELTGLFDIVLDIMSILRERTFQAWIGRTAHAPQVWMTNVFDISTDGRFGSLLEAASMGRTPSGYERPITSKMWADAVRTAGRLENILLRQDLQLWLDARLDILAGDYRRATIDMASAGEIAAEEAAKSIWMAENQTKKFKRARVFTGSDLTDHIAIDLKKFCGYSFEEEHPDVFEVIGQMWQARGKAAHGGRAEYRLSGGLVVPVDEKTSESMHTSTAQCLEWLQTLPTRKPTFGA